MTDIYYNTSLTLGVGAQNVYADLDFDVVDGFVYRIKEADLILYSSLDTANTHHTSWFSVLKDGRTTYNAITGGFPGDIIGLVSKPKGFMTIPFESSEAGYIANDPYFDNRVRLGLSSFVNVAGGAVTLHARIVAERIKATTEIRQLMYNRSYT